MKKCLFVILLLLIFPFTANASDLNVEESNFDAFICADNVRVRESHSLNSKIIGILKIGTSIKCIAVTKGQDAIGADSYCWYKCTPRAFGVTGWVYGKFVSKEKFNNDKFIKTFPSSQGSSKKYKLLIDTNWSTCDGDMPIDCYGMSFKGAIIEVVGMDGNFVYHIESIKDVGNTILINSKLIMANISIGVNDSQSQQYIIEVVNAKTIRVNNGMYYKVK